MIRIEIEQTDNVIDVIKKIRSMSDLNVELVIPEEAVIFENSLNFKLIQYEADKLEKSVEFITDDEVGSNMLSSITGKNSPEYIPEEFEQYKEPKEKLRVPGFFLELMVKALA